MVSCLSLPWRYRLTSKTHYNKFQSKTNIWWKFHIHSSLGRLSNCQFKKLGMILKKLYWTTLNAHVCWLKWFKIGIKDRKAFLKHHQTVDPHARAPRLVGDCLGVILLIFNFKLSFQNYIKSPIFQDYFS